MWAFTNVVKKDSGMYHITVTESITGEVIQIDQRKDNFSNEALIEIVTKRVLELNDRKADEATKLLHLQENVNIGGIQ